MGRVFDEAQLKQKCAEWQKILRLQDWIVDVKICRERDMKLNDCYAECELNLKKKMAHIRILDPIDFPPDDEQDMELSLVHELLHLHFSPLSVDGKDIEEEQAIEAISQGLLRVKYGEVGEF